MSPSFSPQCIARLPEIGDPSISKVKAFNRPEGRKLRTKGKVKNMVQKLSNSQRVRGALAKTGICAIAITVVAIALVRAQAPEIRPVRFSGVINDYTPSTVAGGPYEIHGEWSLDMQKNGTASFSADLSMETSDYGISGATQVDPANPATRNPHTHHISMTDATVSSDTSSCPANNPPTTYSALMVTGTATTTGNGGPAPFDAKGPSTLQVCIMGGSQVVYSNLTLVYTGPATGHIGAQPIHGVVRKASIN
jgi:hypothetical protein